MSAPLRMSGHQRNLLVAAMASSYFIFIVITGIIASTAAAAAAATSSSSLDGVAESVASASIVEQQQKQQVRDNFNHKLVFLFFFWRSCRFQWRRAKWSMMKRWYSLWRYCYIMNEWHVHIHVGDGRSMGAAIKSQCSAVQCGLWWNCAGERWFIAPDSCVRSCSSLWEVEDEEEATSSCSSSSRLGKVRFFVIVFVEWNKRSRMGGGPSQINYLL